MNKWPFITTQYAQSWEYTYNKHRYTKAPLVLHFTPYSLHLRADNHYSWQRHGHSYNVSKGITGKVNSLLRSELEYSITHHWFFSTPPQSNQLPFELDPQDSSSPSANSTGSGGRNARSLSISSHCWKWFLPGEETETRRETVPHMATLEMKKVCLGVLQIPLFHPLQSQPWVNQCWTHTHEHLLSPSLDLSAKGKMSLPENSSPRSIRAFFTASYPCKTSMGFILKYEGR